MKGFSMHIDRSVVRPSVTDARRVHCDGVGESRASAVALRLLVLSAIAGMTFVGASGCALFRGGSKVPAGPTSSTSTIPTTTGPQRAVFPGDTYTDAPVANPADLMFASDEPFAAPPSNINTFGELDGTPPAPFNGLGKAGFQQHTFVDEGYDADVRVSPDGDWLLFSSTRHSVHPDIYLQKIDGLSVTQLTSDPADDAFPTFCPKMKQIAFASNRSGNWDIYVMDADGKNVRQITRGLANEIHPSFSPDGTRLVFSALGTRSGQWELWIVDLNTLERKMIGYGLFPEWSPRSDIDRIAFQRARQRGTRWFSAWTVDLVDGEARQATEVAFSTNAAIVAPTWSPEGKRIAFTTIVDPNAASPATLGGHARGTTQDVWVINADGTERRRLTDGRGVNAQPAWGRDGRIFFVSDRGGTDAIWSVGVEDAPKTMTADTPLMPVP
jgi:TolB protein